MSIYNKDVTQYINSLYKDFEGEIGKLQKYGYENKFPIISKDVAKFLTTIISIKKPKEVLEIGCCIGFSASLMASFTQKDTHITTIERYSVMIEKAKETFNRLNIKNRVTLLEGDAINLLKKIDKKFDFIFLDAAKGQYIQFLPYCLNILNVGGVIIADNVMQNGDIAKQREDIVKRQRTIHKNMRNFLYTITHTEGLESSIIQIGDGVSISTKLKENIIIGDTYE